MEGNVITMQEIFRFEQRGVDKDGKILGRVQRHRRAPRVMERIERFGHRPGATSCGRSCDGTMATTQIVIGARGVRGGRPPRRPVFHTLALLRRTKQDELKRRRLQNLGGTEAASLALLRAGQAVGDARPRRAPARHPGGRAARAAARAGADLALTVARLLTFCGCAALAAGVAGGFVCRRRRSLASILLACGWPSPIIVVLSASRAAQPQKLSEQLPDALDMMARSLRAGHALTSAFKLVATEMPPPIASSSRRAFEEQNLGMPFERAVLQMTKRAPTNRDLKIFAVSVIIQKETGGNLVEIIEKIADTIRQRYRFYGKLRTLTAEGRCPATSSAPCPSSPAAVHRLRNPHYMRTLLVTTRSGARSSLTAVIMWVRGLRCGCDAWPRWTYLMDGAEPAPAATDRRSPRRRVPSRHGHRHGRARWHAVRQHVRRARRRGRAPRAHALAASATPVRPRPDRRARHARSRGARPDAAAARRAGPAHQEPPSCRGCAAQLVRRRASAARPTPSRCSWRPSCFAGAPDHRLPRGATPTWPIALEFPVDVALALLDLRGRLLRAQLWLGVKMQGAPGRRSSAACRTPWICW